MFCATRREESTGVFKPAIDTTSLPAVLCASELPPTHKVIKGSAPSTPTTPSTSPGRRVRRCLLGRAVEVIDERQGTSSSEPYELEQPRPYDHLGSSTDLFRALCADQRSRGHLLLTHWQ